MISPRTKAAATRSQRFLFAAAYALSTLAAANATAQTAGAFDTSFSGDGRVETVFLPSGATNASPNATAIQRDGNIVVAGRCVVGVAKMCLARLRPNGSLDPDFNGTNPLQPGNGRFMFAIGGASDLVEAIAIQADGKIVVGGACIESNQYRHCIARLNPDGSFDAHFDGIDPLDPADGRFMFTIGDESFGVSAIAIQPDGKTVIAAKCKLGVDTRMCVARFNVNGSYDSSFVGPDGNGAGRFIVPTNSFSIVNSIALQSDGKIVLGGHCGADFCLARLTATGHYDSAFVGPSGNANGRFRVAIGSDDSYGHSVKIQPDGKIVLAGNCRKISSAQRAFCVVRVNADGSIDMSLSGPSGDAAGKVVIEFTSGAEAAGLALQDDGKMVLYGHCWDGSANVGCLARLNSDGSFDRGFDGAAPLSPGQGKFLLPIASLSVAPSAIAVQRDGNIVIAQACGTTTTHDFCVARLHGGSQGYETCSLDIDGDGAISANDAIIHARIALGFRGAEVVSGLSFSPNATRASWTAIQAHLISQCGLVSP